MISFVYFLLQSVTESHKFMFMTLCLNRQLIVLDETDIILSRDAVGVSPASDGIESRMCFYDVLADHYVKVPQDGKAILDLIVQLWSQSFASHIFALLFHKWVCDLFGFSTCCSKLFF